MLLEGIELIFFDLLDSWYERGDVHALDNRINELNSR
jgi:hypothetical protein